MTIYLYVKQHRETGLKYFGVTTKKDPYNYLGSGKYWRRHLRQHGSDVLTLHVWKFLDEDECAAFALNYSHDNNIVESTMWANLQPENGRPGRPVGCPGMKGDKNPQYGMIKELNSFYGKKHTPETIELYKRQKARGNNPRAKRIYTPLGVFDCITDGAEVHGVHRDTLKRRVTSKEGYGYIH